MQSTISAVQMTRRVPSLLMRGAPAAKISVVVVDTDDTFHCRLSNELSELGFAVTTFSDAQSILAASDSLSTADLIVLDWGESRPSGLEILCRLRSLGIYLPVVFLARRSLTSNESLAFEHGAIDYIDKSRGIAILPHRLRIVASVKVPAPRQDEVVQVGNLILKPGVKRAFWNGTDVHLTLGEFKIINLLASKVGRQVTYREIYDAMRHPGFIAGCGVNGYRTNVRSAIKRVRRKFEVCDPAFSQLQNYTAFGYIWAVD